MLLFLFAVIVIYFSKKKKEIEFLLAAVLFKTNFLVELGMAFCFLEGNDVLNRTSGKSTSPTLSRLHFVVI